ncbi:helix-turn-helix transcriptional regulator [Nocardia neocaledoniensis]|uniref:helix-turn-helix transcriptional regulator n=1 Tax=Nocardia neocaledoniensis TaxID=236511 RepID=UPI002457134B|nr:helix-turn-helix transcriptional regulator [Nocardia neocaledoniensis]
MVAAPDRDLDPAVAVRVRAAIRAATPDRSGLGRVLFELSRVVAYQHAALSRWDPVARVHHTATSIGYSQVALEVTNSCLHTHPLFTRLQHDQLPIRLCEVPADVRYGPIFDRVILPLGYREGLTQPLFAADGRYLGMLNMSTTVHAPFPTMSVTALALLADVVGAAIDPCRGIAVPVDHEESVVIVTGSGSVHPVTAPAAAHPFVSGGAGVELARAVAASGQAGGHLLLDGDVVYRTRMQPVHSGGTLVAYRRIDPPHGLTPRELHVLALLPQGSSNARIAADLRVEPSTIATHIERILRKLHAPNRTVAAATAVRWGLTVNSVANLNKR